MEEGTFRTAGSWSPEPDLASGLRESAYLMGLIRIMGGSRSPFLLCHSHAGHPEMYTTFQGHGPGSHTGGVSGLESLWPLPEEFTCPLPSLVERVEENSFPQPPLDQCQHVQVKHFLYTWHFPSIC